MGRTHEDIENELLVLRSQAGDAKALRALVECWQPRFARLAWRLTAHRDAAQDIAQETWLAIVRGLRRLDDPASFRAWAYRIVSRKCADWVRTRVARRRVAHEAQAANNLQGGTNSRDSAKTADTTGDIESLRGILARLPDEQRVALALHYLDGMSVVQIARLLDVPPGTVKSRLYHARQRLKQAMERIET